MKIAIDGNIGSGKSTLMKELSSVLSSVALFPEPVERWTLLSSFYNDKERFALSFSLQVLTSIGSNNIFPNDLIMERSPLTAKQVFTKSLADKGIMGLEEFSIYCKVYDVLGWKPDVIIYIDTPVETCFERINRRNRKGENGKIDMSYLYNLEEYYKTMLSDAIQQDIIVLSIDGSQSKTEVLNQCIGFIKRLYGVMS